MVEEWLIDLIEADKVLFRPLEVLSWGCGSI